MSFFEHPFRVRYAETDRMGVSYYANYLVWFEMGRAEYLRFLRIQYTDYEKKGIFLPVVEAHCRYLRFSTYDDLLAVQVVVSEFGKSSMRFDYRILKEPERVCIVEGYTVHAFINTDRKPIRVPQEVRDKVSTQHFEP